ncbi:preprotein translocase subunit SecE [Catenovulum agarivorans DS-2]|uniref:Protein translocase subunit SecE n=1 Tax=Catenovulum agarivorans DS-2 TaxID=1328313 RepID=W7QS81_9ALTE|nr:preprotein translocase subunit SecE [Catenovulum agarivorans]EWH08270.1 preprotein translocase subunit SecE [Catenovulum agarivorans DS-2]
MSVETENQGSRLDPVKWILTFAILSAAVVGNYLYTEQVSVLWRAIAVVAAVVVAGLIAAQTGKGRDAIDFAKESRTEVRKVIWPTRDEAWRTTAIVLVATVIMALILWGLDGIMVRAVSFLTGLGL